MSNLESRQNEIEILPSLILVSCTKDRYIVYTHSDNRIAIDKCADDMAWEIRKKEIVIEKIIKKLPILSRFELGKPSEISQYIINRLPKERREVIEDICLSNLKTSITNISEYTTYLAALDKQDQYEYIDKLEEIISKEINEKIIYDIILLGEECFKKLLIKENWKEVTRKELLSKYEVEYSGEKSGIVSNNSLLNSILVKHIKLSNSDKSLQEISNQIKDICNEKKNQKYLILIYKK